jgi:hypothetical protein
VLELHGLRRFFHPESLRSASVLVSNEHLFMRDETVPTTPEQRARFFASMMGWPNRRLDAVRTGVGLIESVDHLRGINAVVPRLLLAKLYPYLGECIHYAACRWRGRHG